MLWVVSKLPDTSIKGVLVALKSKLNSPDGASARANLATKVKSAKTKKNLAPASVSLLGRWLVCTGRAECPNLNQTVKHSEIGLSGRICIVLLAGSAAGPSRSKRRQAETSEKLEYRTPVLACCGWGQPRSDPWIRVRPVCQVRPVPPNVTWRMRPRALVRLNVPFSPAFLVVPNDLVFRESTVIRKDEFRESLTKRRRP